MMRKEIKRKIIASLDEKELVRLNFSIADTQKRLKWKHSKEFEFNGEMFDIVSVKKTSDSIEYYCWWDSEESVLNRKLMALVGLNLADLPENRELQFQLSNFYKNIFFNKDERIELYLTKNVMLVYSSCTYKQKTDKTFSGYNSNNSPPPEIL